MVRKKVDIAIKDILSNYVPRNTYEKLKGSKIRFENECKNLKQENYKLSECQRQLGLLGKVK